MKDILEQSTLRLPSGWRIALWVFVALGALMFIIGLVMGDAERTWQAFLINTMYWGGMAFTGVMLSVIWQITDAKWGRPFKRIAEGFSGFLPVALAAFALIFFGAHSLYEWVEAPMPAKEGYLNLNFFIVRNVIGLGLLFLLTMRFIRTSLKPDFALAQKVIPSWGGSFAQRLLKNYGDHDTEVHRLEQSSRRQAPVLAIVFTFVFTMVAFDYVMSLDQEWFSTLFGVHLIIGHLYTALAMTLILVAIIRQMPGMGEFMTINRFHDLAKLTFAISALYAYMVFTQFLVIWYSNLPEEAPFLVTRAIADTPWRPLFWILVGVLFVFPFLTLMPRTVCRNPKITSVIAGIMLVGQWWAHYLLIVPSIQDRHGEPHFYFGAHEVLITMGFLGAFFLSFFWFMSRVPTLPISDRHLIHSWHGH